MVALNSQMVSSTIWNEVSRLLGKLPVTYEFRNHNHALDINFKPSNYTFALMKLEAVINYILYWKIYLSPLCPEFIFSSTNFRWEIIVLNNYAKSILNW